MALYAFLEQGVNGRCYLQNMVLAQPVTGDFRSGVRMDIFKKMWIKLLKEYDNKIGFKWKWQSIDSLSIKSPLGGVTESNPTDRSKMITKRHILTDKKEISLSVIIKSANTHDIEAVTDVIDNAVIKRRPSTIALLSTTKEKRRKQQ